MLDEIIDACKLHKLDKGLSRSLLLLLLYDLLFGSHRIEGGGHFKRLVLQNRTPIQSALARIYIKRHASSPLQLLPLALRPRPPHPRYVRINTLLCSQQQAIDALQADGWVEVERPARHPTRADPFAFPSPQSFYRDMDVDGLLVFPPLTTFHSTQLYEAGWVVLQDKASCMSAACLNPTAEDVVVDGCAAPGNKTSHILALVKQSSSGDKGRAEGSVDAFEVHPSRFTLLTRMLSQKGIQVSVRCPARCHPPIASVTAGSGLSVTAHHANFLSIKPDDPLGARVTAVLLDPTCSGSGMSNTLDAYYKENNREAEAEAKSTDKPDTHTRRAVDRQSGVDKKRKRTENNQRERKEESAPVSPAQATTDEEDGSGEQEQQSGGQSQSLSALSAFQTSLVLHAFTLPSVTHIVYSTCSHHTAENEAVIAASLAHSGRRLGWEVEAGLLPHWTRRGRVADGLVGLSSDECERMVRCEADDDCMNGFFVCGLVKRTGQAGMAKAGLRQAEGGEVGEVRDERASDRVAEVSGRLGNGVLSGTASHAVKSKKRKKKKQRVNAGPQL